VFFDRIVDEICLNCITFVIKSQKSPSAGAIEDQKICMHFHWTFIKEYCTHSERSLFFILNSPHHN